MHSSPLYKQRLMAGIVLLTSFVPACASRKPEEQRVRVYAAPDYAPPPPRVVDDHDQTLRGAGIGAAAGAAGALLIGKHAADQILIGAAIGAVAGAGIGAYLDAQEARLGRIPGCAVERVGRDTLVVRFDSDVLFPIDSDRPTAASMTTLAEVGDTLVRYPRTAVVVQGHTDSTGPEEYNQELSERRATMVKDILVDRGVNPRRLVAIGHGELYPVASNSFEEGRRRNRRVTLLLKSRA
jgi:outer membrane protein OmpA-like peptidoglycan-associated protein